jgi:hypothetical protein
MDTCTSPKCKKRLLENDAHTPSPKRARKDLSLTQACQFVMYIIHTEVWLFNYHKIKESDKTGLIKYN